MSLVRPYYASFFKAKLMFSSCKSGVKYIYDAFNDEFNANKDVAIDQEAVQIYNRLEIIDQNHKIYLSVCHMY